MAKNIKIGIKLDKSGFQKELNQLLKNGYDLNLNSGNFKSVINQIVSNTEKLKTELNSIGKGSFDNVTKSAKESMKVFDEYANAIGKVNEISQKRVENRAMKDELAQAKAINQALDEQYKKQLSLNDLKGRLQVKLNTASSNGLVDTTVIDNLQNKLNSINSNSAEKEINELKNAINNLSSNDSGIVRVQQSIVKLEERINKIKGSKIDLINSSDLSELTMAESQLEKLRTTLSSLKSGEVINGRAISNQINMANNSLRTLEQSFSNLNSAGNGLVGTMRNIFSYFVGGSIFYSLLNEVKEGISTIVQLDTALRDLRKVSDLTTQQLSEFTKEASKIGTEIGSSTQSVIKAVEYYSKLGYAIEEATSRAKNATVFSNVADMDIDSASKALITIQKGFNLNTLEDMTRIMDVANEVGNNYSSSSKDVADGLLRMGNALEEAGNSYEQSVGIFVAGNASIQDADVVGNAIKTIAMRLRGMETEIDETSVPVSKLRDEILQLTSTAGQAVDIMNDDNTFKSTYEQLTELAEVYPKLTDGQRAYLQYVIAGQRQGNIFSGIMANMEEGISAYETALNSAGSSAKEQSIYMQSIEGRLNEFRNSVTEVWVNSIDSDFIKNSVSSATWLINTLNNVISTIGGLPTAIGIATASLVAFNSKIRENTSSMLLSIPGYGKMITTIKGWNESLSKVSIQLQTHISNLKKQQIDALKSGKATSVLGKEMLGLNANLALVRAGMVATQVAGIAMNAVLSMGISALISWGVTALSKVIDNVITTKKELKEMSEEFLANRESTQQEIDTLEGLVQKHKQLQKELSNTELTEEQQRTKKEELIGVQKQLAQLLPDTITGYTEEGEAISQNTDAVQKNIDKKKELATQEALDLVEEFDETKWVKLINSYDEQKKKVEELKKSYDALGENEKDPELFKQWQEAQGELDALGEHINVASEAMKVFKEQGFSDEDIADLFFKNFYDVYTDGEERQAKGYERLKIIIDDYTESIKNNTNAKEENNEIQPISEDFALTQLQGELSKAELAIKPANDIMNAFTQAIENGVDPAEALANALNSIDMQSNLKEATKTYADCINEVANLHDIMQKLNEEQALTPSIVAQVASAYPEVGASVTDLASLQDFLQNKINETVQKQSEAFSIMAGNDAQYYASKIANNLEFEQLLNDSINSIVGMQSKGYDIDLSNFSTLNELKTAIQNQFGEAQGQSINGILDMYSRAYTFDSQNFADLQSMKQGYINQLIPAIANWISQFTGGNADGYTADLSNFNDLAEMKAYAISQLSGKMADLQAEWSKVISSYNNAVDQAYANGDDAKALEIESHALRKVKPINEQINRISAQLSTVDKVFGGLESQLNTYEAKFAGATFGGNTNGKGGGSDKGSSSSSKEVENIQVETDRYYDLNNAIEKVNNALEINDILSKNANDDAKLKYIKEEISLYNQKRQALEKLQAEQKKELSEIQGSLSKNGFTFDADGNISNLNSRLKGLESWANSASGTEKENRQNTVKNIQSMIDSYEDLRGKVSDINADILDINNSIIDAQKDIADVIKDQYEEWKDLEEKKTDKLKEEIQKRKEMMEKDWETEDYQDKLDEEQNKLNELIGQRQDAIRTGNENLISQLDKEIEEQRKTINDLIRDQERNNASDKYDEMIDTLDKELDAKLEAMDEKVTDDALLQAVQSGATSLEDIFSNIDLASRSVNKNILMVSDGITDWNTKLNDFVSTLNSISASAISLDLNSSLQGVTTLTGSSNPINISTTINLEGGTVIGETEMNDIITKNNKYIFKEINNIFKR